MMRYLLPTARPIVEDLAGTVAFYLLFVALGDARLAAAVGLAIGCAQIGWHRARREPVPALLMMGVALTAALGALTLLTRDPRFLLAKPSIVYVALGVPMLPRGWVTRYVPAIAGELLPARTFDLVGWSWAALMFATAALNVLFVATLPPTRAAIAFALWATASKLALFAGQYAVLRLRAGRAVAQRTPSSASSRS